MFKIAIKSWRFFQIWRHKSAAVVLGINLAANLFLWLFIYFRLRGTTGAIPLHYNIILGVDVIGPWQQLFVKPLLGLIIFLLNYILAVFFWQKKEKVLSFFLLAASLLVQILLILSTWSIINL